MTKKLEYATVLHMSNAQEDDGRPRLIGNDPALNDQTRWFRWASEPGGWERREEWSIGTVDAHPVPNTMGSYSGWPGAIPIPARPVGRPRKEVEPAERMVIVRTSISRTELFEAQRRASDQQMSVGEWITSLIRERLA